MAVLHASKRCLSKAFIAFRVAPVSVFRSPAGAAAPGAAGTSIAMPRSTTETEPRRRMPASYSRSAGPLATMRRLLVGDGRAAGTGEVHDLVALESRLARPGTEVGAREVEGLAELDQHVKRHQQPEGILAARVVDQVLDGDERAAGGQRVVRGPDQLPLVREVPVVKDHTHRDDVRLG